MRFIDLFHKHVTEQPDHLALVDKKGSLTYSQLNEQAEVLAKQYASQGIGPGDAVGVKVPYSKDIMVHAIAIHKLGAVYVPIDNDYPDDRVQYMRQDSTQEKHDSEVAMIIYTSGTTGRPKGVVHTHKSLMAIVHWLVPHPGEEWLDSQPTPMSPDTRCGIVTGFSFLGTTIMLFSTLAAGGTLYFANTVERLDMASMYQFLQRNSITHIFMSSSLGMAMVEAYDTTGTLICVGGEKLRGFKSKAGQKLLNIYGSTEGAMVCNAYVSGTEQDIPIGKTCPGVITRIVEASPDPSKGGEIVDVKQGEIGELIYSADFMAREYLHLPEQTAAKWQTHLQPSLVGRENIRYYHTGDRVRQDAEGNIYCLGRTDNMVKVRGYRVETGEVERQISLVVPNTELVVVLRRVHGIDHLVCFYQAPEEWDTTVVKVEVSKRLAEYMVPDIWVRMDKFPRNTNGKVIRGELCVPSTNGDKLSAIYNEVEMRVVEAAKFVLGEIISLDDNFFECGGTSLGAIKLATQLKLMGIHTTGSKIMQLKVLRKVAAEAQVDYERLWTPEQWQEIHNSFASRGEHIQKVLPLQTETEDELIRYLMHPDSPMDKSVFVLQVDSILDTEYLQEAIRKGAMENDNIRSSLVIHHHLPFQIAITDRIPKLQVINSDSDNLLPEAITTFNRLMHSPYDPETDCIIDYTYLKGKQGKSYIFVSVNYTGKYLQDIRCGLLTSLTELASHYSGDTSIRDWCILLEQSLQSPSNSPKKKSEGTQLTLPQNNGLIRVYTPLAPSEPLQPSETRQMRMKPSVVFIHTGNTGSDAYYRLADKIGDCCAFSVIEPYNLFHQDDIQHGIKAIAKKYIEILRDYQPQGPYILGGWCYGGIVAHEMACQLQAMGETVSHLIMFDSHALAQPTSSTSPEPSLTSMAADMMGDVNREYFETSPLFQDLREQGLLEAMVRNSAQVSYDMLHHTPSLFHGPVTYFKPLQTPMAATGKALEYWKKMMEFDAGNYENYCDRNQLHIYNTPHEHDLMMDDESLSITVPIIKKLLQTL